MIKTYDIFINGQKAFRTSNHNSTFNSAKEIANHIKAQKTIKVASVPDYEIIIHEKDKIKAILVK